MHPSAQLAKRAAETYTQTGEIIPPSPDFPREFLDTRAGVFVTIYNGKSLRGCIGTYRPTQKNIAQEIISNAIAACSHDYRFRPISIEELAALRYEVSVLTNPKQVKNFSELNPQKCGIIVSAADGRSGLLLPDIDGVDSAEQQIAIACQKGRINPAIDKILLYKFETEKYS